MVKFSEYFGKTLSQAELDFVDIDTSCDTPLYLDPYAIQIRQDDWSSLCGDYIRSYFSELLDAMREDNWAKIEHLTIHLHEPNETFLGVSSGKPSGRGLSRVKADMIVDAIKNSFAFKTGQISDVSEASLYIAGIGPDTISDLTTNVLRGPLADYTEEQCDLHGIEVNEVNFLPPVWNPGTSKWEANSLHLPLVKGEPVLLIPKFSVRRRLCLDSQEFYNHHLLTFHQQEHLNAGSALVEVLKNKRRRVTKKKLKKLYPYSKDLIAEFAQENPKVIEFYKSLKGAEGTIKNVDIDDDINEQSIAKRLSEELDRVETGGKYANIYHNLAMSICTFLFYPDLIHPIKEKSLHEGRKRIDINFTNAAHKGFFFTVLEAPQTRALHVAVECKNYSSDPKNPEYDQLAGRFSLRNGYFGILLCRTIEDKDHSLEICKDAAKDNRGFMLVLDDADLQKMLSYVENHNRPNINRLLHRKFDALST